MFKKLLKRIICLFPCRKIILMESVPDFSDSTKVLFDYLIEKKVNEDYKIIWIVVDDKKFKNVKIKNVKFVKRKSFAFEYYTLFSKVIIDSNNFICKRRKDQFRLHLTHGTPLKKCDFYLKDAGDLDYICEIGSYLSKTNSELFGVEQSKMIQPGFCRNDILYNHKKVKKKIYKNQRVIVWLPTYRQHNKQSIAVSSDFKFGVPCIDNKKELDNVNNALKQSNIVLLIKLHPAQKVDGIKEMNLSNIKFITNEYLAENNMTSYELMAISDALITDYSTVYYDYLLTKNPIGLAISDIDIYEKEFGFALDYYKEITGFYIYNNQDLIKFINEVASGKDSYYSKREKTAKKFFDYVDGNATKRTYEFLKKHL